MELKIQIVEGFHTTIWKKPISIETDDYPELKGMTQDQVIEYINKNSNRLPAIPNDDPDNWSLYDELMGQDKELEKEKNNETCIDIWTK